ncbi:MAG: TA system antitoxin ParD family protein [Azonexus sp.]
MKQSNLATALSSKPASCRLFLSTKLNAQAKTDSATECHTIAGQVEYWILVRRGALDNPEQPAKFISDALPGRFLDL